jgi:hypothetical protein
VSTDRRTVVIDGQTIETDARAADAIEALSARLAAQQGHQPPFAAGQRIDFRDARLADWLSAGAAEVYRQRANAKNDLSTPYGRYCAALRDAWKAGRSAA